MHARAMEEHRDASERGLVDLQPEALVQLLLGALVLRGVVELVRDDREENVDEDKLAGQYLGGAFMR